MINSVATSLLCKYTVYGYVKRRDFLRSAPIGILVGTSGCIGPFSEEPEDPENEPDNTEAPEGKTNFGRSEQIQLTIFEPDVEYEEIERGAYRYQGNLYSDKGLATLVGSRRLADETRSILENNRILRDDAISVRTAKVDPSQIDNSNVRDEFDLDRSDNTTVVVEYDIQTEENGLERPDTSYQDVLDILPHSAEIDVQFEFGRVVVVLPVVARSNVN